MNMNSSKNSRVKSQKTPAQRAAHAKIVNAIKANVNNHWDQVFEAMYQEYTGMTKSQVLEKLQSVIGFNTSFKDGQVRIHTSKGIISLENASVYYYVDPSSKLIMENPYPKKRQDEQRQRTELDRKTQLQRLRKMSDTLICLKTENGWTAVELSPVDSDPKGYYDVMLKRRVYLNIWSDIQELQKLYAVKNMYGKECRILTAREVSHLKLDEVAN